MNVLKFAERFLVLTSWSESSVVELEVDAEIWLLESEELNVRRILIVPSRMACNAERPGRSRLSGLGRGSRPKLTADAKLSWVSLRSIFEWPALRKTYLPSSLAGSTLCIRMAPPFCGSLVSVIK